jgi:hypothetical protein
MISKLVDGTSYSTKIRLQHYLTSTMIGPNKYGRMITTVPRTIKNKVRFLNSNVTTTTTVAGNTGSCTRGPTPPMPRIAYQVVLLEDEMFKSTKTRTTMFQALRNWWDSGTILIGIGWMGLVTIMVELYLQRSIAMKESVDREQMIQDIVYSAQQQRQLLYEQYRTAPALYQCRVIHYYKMGGSHGLQNVKLNDVVDVLSERVGPKQLYHLCRFIRTPTVTTTNVDADVEMITTKDKTMKNKTQHLYQTENGDITELGWYPITHLEPYVQPPKPWWRRFLFR